MNIYYFKHFCVYKLQRKIFDQQKGEKRINTVTRCPIFKM